MESTAPLLPERLQIFSSLNTFGRHAKGPSNKSIESNLLKHLPFKLAKLFNHHFPEKRREIFFKVVVKV